MPRALGLLILAACAFALCGSSCSKVVYKPDVVQSEKLLYVPVPAELLRQHPIATGTLAECPAVAAKRRDEIVRCNADKGAIEEIRGTTVPKEQ